MGIEIEKKFLTKDGSWRELGEGKEYCQGYLSDAKGQTVRIRTIGQTAFLTVKGPSVAGKKLEFEYEIPHADAQIMLEDLCHRPLIHKTRYRIPHKGFIWEVDDFHGENDGLILAEIELESVDQRFELPPWIGMEVTNDPRYYNAALVRAPYREWKLTN